MEPLIYVVAIMGCADGSELCEPVAQAPMRFESKSACVAYVETALAGYTDLPYPVIAAQFETKGLQTAAS